MRKDLGLNDCGVCALSAGGLEDVPVGIGDGSGNRCLGCLCVDGIGYKR